MRKSQFASILFSSAVLMFPVAARAQQFIQSQEGIALQNEIEQLQAQVQQLQSGAQNNGSSVLGGSAAPPPQPAGGGAPVAGGLVGSLLTQVQQLQSQVQSLRGRVDELQNQVNQQNTQTQKEIGDLNFRVTGSATPGVPAAAGAAAGQPPALTPPAAASTTPAPAVVPNDPKSQLRAALDAYDKGDYKAAASLSSALVKSHPQAAEAYRAQYLSAQSYAASGNDQDAAIAYDNTYNMNRTGSYAPQSLLGLASSLAGIGANDEACSTLSSLNSQFPTPPAGMQLRIDAVSKQANCN